MLPTTPSFTSRWTTQLEQLYVARKDRDFLIQAVPHHERLRNHPFGDLYDEVAERTLWHLLQDGDLEALATVLDVLRPESQCLELTQLAEGVTALYRKPPAESPNREWLQRTFAQLEPDSVHCTGFGRWWRRIGPVLRALSIEPTEDESLQEESRRLLRRIALPLRREVTEFLQLERRLIRHRKTLRAIELPGRISTGQSRGQRLWTLFRSLRGFRPQIYRPGRRSIHRLEQALVDLNEFEDLGLLPAAAAHYLALFQDLLATERVLGRARPGHRPEELYDLLMSRWRRTLAATPSGAIQRLLTPLHISCRERWVDLLPGLGHTTDPLTGEVLPIPLNSSESAELTEDDLEPLLYPWRRSLLERTLRS